MSVRDYDYGTDHGNYESLGRQHSRSQVEDEAKQSFLPYLGLSEIKEIGTLLKSITAEFFGTSLLVLAGCGSCMGGDHTEDSVQLMTRPTLCAFPFALVSLWPPWPRHLAMCLAVTSTQQSPWHLFLEENLGLLKVSCICRGNTRAVMLYAVVPSEARGAAGLGKTSLAANVTIV
jgi:hypothetical protein